MSKLNPNEAPDGDRAEEEGSWQECTGCKYEYDSKENCRGIKCMAGERTDGCNVILKDA